MTMDVAARFTPQAFQFALALNDEYSLLKHWRDCPFYTLFVREKTGGEIPATLDIGRGKAYASSSDEKEVATLMETATVPESDGELFIRTASLAELARNAVVQGFSIYWLGPSQLIEGSTLRLLADTAIVKDSDGNEVAYKSEALFFEGGVEQPAPPKGAVQRWDKVALGKEKEYSTERTPTLYVYDDALDWQTNPYLPELPESAVPVSSLSQRGQDFFRSWETPLFGAQEDASPPKPPEQSEGTDGLVPNDWLAGFGSVRELVDKHLVPTASELRLAIKVYEPSDGSDWGEVYWRLDLDVPSSFGSLMPCDWVLVSASSFKANPGLPEETGKHPVTEAFRERLVRQLSWRIFENGRRLGERFYLGSDHFQRFFPFRPDNADKTFQPDYEDARFPCLARFRCGDYEIPVLLQGQIRGNYVCEPLRDIAVPESEVPSMMPGRNLLIADGVMQLFDSAGGILVPAELIDFPEHWFNGARASSQQVTYQLEQSGRIDRLVEAYAQAMDEEEADGRMLRNVTWGVSLTVALLLVLAFW